MCRRRSRACLRSDDDEGSGQAEAGRQAHGGTGLRCPAAPGRTGHPTPGGSRSPTVVQRTRSPAPALISPGDAAPSSPAPRAAGPAWGGGLACTRLSDVQWTSGIGICFVLEPMPARAYFPCQDSGMLFLPRACFCYLVACNKT